MSHPYATSTPIIDVLADTESANDLPPHLPVASRAGRSVSSFGRAGMDCGLNEWPLWRLPARVARFARVAYLNWRLAQLRRDIEFMESDLNLLPDLIRQHRQMSQRLRQEAQRMTAVLQAG